MATDPATGWSIRIRELDSADDPRFYHLSFDSGPGISVTGAGGYGVGGLRLEAEFSYTATDIGYWDWELTTTVVT